METKKVILTHAGMEKMEKELFELKTVKRQEVAQKIKEARAQGDLSENAEYDAAKEEQGTIEARIVEIEKMLRNAQVIDEEETSVDKVSLGSVVVLYDYEFEEDITYTIVGSTEADPMEGLISNESPVGAALLGKTVGEDVEVSTPGGVMKFKVKEISR
jgi:transcription elongation factor GreA